jgi:hypothetical protein
MEPCSKPQNQKLLAEAKKLQAEADFARDIANFLQRSGFENLEAALTAHTEEVENV